MTESWPDRDAKDHLYDPIVAIGREKRDGHLNSLSFCSILRGGAGGHRKVVINRLAMR